MDMTADAVRDANMRWLEELGNKLEALDKRTDGMWADAKITYYPSDALNRMYGELSDASVSMIVIGYSCMLLFVIITQVRTCRPTGGRLASAGICLAPGGHRFGIWPPTYRPAANYSCHPAPAANCTCHPAQIPWCSCEASLQLAPVGVAGFFLILLANCAAYGAVAWVLGFKFNHTMLQALPFLALGLGVDDLFLMLHAFKEILTSHKGVKGSEVLGLTFAEAGSSITITSWCNAVVFAACAAIIPIRALQALLIAAALIVLMNWLCAMCMIPPLLALWASFFADGTTIEEAKRKEKIYGDDELAQCPLANGFTGFYKLFSTSLPCKLLFFVIGAGLLIGFSACIPNVEMGYKESDLAKKGSYLGEGITEMYENVYSRHSAENLVFGVGVDFAKDQEQLLKTFDRLANSSWSAYGTASGRSCGSSANCWIRNMYGATGITPFRGWYNDNLVSEVNGSQVRVGCDPGGAHDPHDPCRYEPDPWWTWNQDLHTWRKPQTFLPVERGSAIAFGGLLAGLLDRANSFAYEVGPGDHSEAADELYYGAANKLLLSFDEIEIQADLISGPGKTPDKIRMIKEFKEILDDSGLNLYMYSWLFIQMEQFLSLEYYFWQVRWLLVVPGGSWWLLVASGGIWWLPVAYLMASDGF